MTYGLDITGLETLFRRGSESLGDIDGLVALPGSSLPQIKESEPLVADIKPSLSSIGDELALLRKQVSFF